MRRCCSWLRGRPLDGGSVGVSLQELPTQMSYKSALDSILQNCEMLRFYELSSEALQLLVNIETSVDRLRPLVSTDNNDLGPELWPCPPAQEQAEWVQLRPGGGRLLHTQVCIAAVGISSEEWFMGRLFISERGIAIQGTSGIYAGSHEAALSTGLLAWENIEGIESNNCELRISLKEVALIGHFLRLQLGLSAECDRVRKAWAYYFIDMNCPFHSFIEGDDAGGAEDSLGPLEARRSTRGSGLSFLQRASAEITQSFLAASNELPAQGIFKDTKPLCSGHVPNVTMATVRRFLEKNDDWFLCRFQKDVLKAWDMTVTPWTQGQLISGTTVRRLCFKFPAPKDVPKTVANMIGFPEFLDTNLVARLHCTDASITLLMHSCSLNVPYGDCQRLEDVLVFTANANGGVNVSKWIKIVWVKSIPWTLNMVKGFLEGKVKDEGASTWEQLIEVMRREFTK